MAPHLHLEPGCLEGLTWLQKGQVVPLAGCKEEEKYIYTLTIFYLFAFTVSKHNREEMSYLASFDFTIHT